MAKVTSKYQVTVPRAIADQYSIRPGAEIAWIPAGDAIRVVTERTKKPLLDLEERVRLFDLATDRIRVRAGKRKQKRPRERGWTREDLYGRGRSH